MPHIDGMDGWFGWLVGYLRHSTLGAGGGKDRGSSNAQNHHNSARHHASYITPPAAIRLFSMPPSTLRMAHVGGFERRRRGPYLLTFMLGEGATEGGWRTE